VLLQEEVCYEPMTPHTNLSLFCSGILNMHCFIGNLESTRTYLHQHKHSSERANKWRLNYCRLSKHPSHWYDNTKLLEREKEKNTPKKIVSG